METIVLAIFIALVVAAIMLGMMIRRARRKRQQEHETAQQVLYGPPLESYTPEAPPPLDELVTQAVQN